MGEKTITKTEKGGENPCQISQQSNTLAKSSIN